MDLPVDPSTAGAQHVDVRTEAAPQPESEPELEPELWLAPQTGAHRHEGWLATDGGVSGGKLKRFWHVLTADSHLKWFKDKDARTLFDELDADASGALDIDEVTVLCKSLGKTLNKKEIDAALEAMDADGSGEISFDEFQPWWEAENAKAAKRREAVGSIDLRRVCEAVLDPEDGKKETLQVAILGKTLSLKSDDEAAAKKWMAAFAGVTAASSRGMNSSSVELSTSMQGHTLSPTVSKTAQPGRVGGYEEAGSDDGQDHGDEDGSFLDEHEDERRKLAAHKRGRRGARTGAALTPLAPSRLSDDDIERGRRGARGSSSSDRGSPDGQSRDGEKDLRHRHSKHGKHGKHSKHRKHAKHRGNPSGQRRSHSRHRRSSARSSRSERREVDLGFDSEDEYGHVRVARQRELPREARRMRYTDAPRYSGSHRAMSKPRDEEYTALPKGTPAPAIPLRTHAHEYEYSPNNTHASGYHGASIVEHLELDDEWHTQTTHVPVSSPMLVGSGAIVSRGPNPRKHLLAEFRESFLPFEQRQEMIETEERAVIIEPGAEADLNKYLRHGWRVKSTQPGTDNAFLVIVEREQRNVRD